MMFSSRSKTFSKNGVFEKSSAVGYALILVVCAMCYHPAVVTVSAAVQCGSIAMLVAQAVTSGSTAGISASALALDALSLVFRLSGTVWLDGYLPVDWTGDWLFQTIDVFSLAMLIWLLHDMFFARRFTWKSQEETFPVAPAVILSLILGAILHANMHDHPVFDILWMAGLIMNVVAVMPQYGLILKTGGLVEPLISHHIAAMALSKFLCGIYMWWARFDIECDFWVENVNHAVLSILGVHMLHLVFLADFGYYYIKTLMTRGFGARLELPLYQVHV